MLIHLDKILLEDEQLELFDIIVEAARNTPRENRQKFVVIQTTEGDILIHPGLSENKEIYIGDVEILANNGLLQLTARSNTSYQFDVTPLGFKFYEYVKRKTENSTVQIETQIKKYFYSADFEKNYQIAYQKWIEAENLLWSSESDKQHTMIGHLCRETIQEFVQHIVERKKKSNIERDKSRTVSRLKTILAHQSVKLSNDVKDFLDAIIAYWGTLSDLIQRQEHGAQKEGLPLNWEDSRKVVFNTLILMYGIDRTIK